MIFKREIFGGVSLKSLISHLPWSSLIVFHSFSPPDSFSLPGPSMCNGFHTEELFFFYEQSVGLMFASGGKWPSRELPVRTLQCAGLSTGRWMLHNSRRRHLGGMWEMRGGRIRAWRRRGARAECFSDCCGTQTWVTGTWNGSVATNPMKSWSSYTMCNYTMWCKVQTENYVLLKPFNSL